LEPDGGDLARTRRLGAVRFEAQVRKEVARWGASKPCLPIARKIFSVLDDRAGVLAHRPGALERVALVLADWHETTQRCAAAETGDLRRFASARAVVKHAGLAPRQKASGAFTGRTQVTGQGRPSLRLAAWRAAWAVLQNNPVYAARYKHLVTREQNRLTPNQA